MESQQEAKIAMAHVGEPFKFLFSLFGFCILQFVAEVSQIFLRRQTHLSAFKVKFLRMGKKFSWLFYICAFLTFIVFYSSSVWWAYPEKVEVKDGEIKRNKFVQRFIDTIKIQISVLA